MPRNNKQQVTAPKKKKGFKVILIVIVVALILFFLLPSLFGSNSPEEVSNPAQTTIQPKITTDIEQVHISVDKVEFDSSETRVWVTLTNNSKLSSDIASPSSAIIQNGQQYAHLSGYFEDDYDVFPDFVKANASDSGVLLYPAIEVSDFNLVLPVSVNEKGYKDIEIPISVKR